VKEIRKSFSKKESWSHRVVNTENNSATLIHQQPGEGNRRHYHPDWNEWWYIVDGEWEWEIDGETKMIKKDDVVFIPKGVVHKITAVGDKPAIRLAVSREDVAHVYPDGDHVNEN
jgi:quercetin dioxygenase-like cupin family protein